MVPRFMGVFIERDSILKRKLALAEAERRKWYTMNSVLY